MCYTYTCHSHIRRPQVQTHKHVHLLDQQSWTSIFYPINVKSVDYAHARMDNHMIGLKYACADDRGGAEIVTFDPKTGDQLERQEQAIPVGLQG